MKIKIVDVKLFLISILVVLICSIGVFYSFHNYNSIKNERVMDLKNQLNHLDGLVVTHWKSFTQEDIDNTENKLKSVYKQKGFTLENSILVFTIFFSIGCAVFFGAAPDMFKITKN